MTRAARQQIIEAALADGATPVDCLKYVEATAADVAALAAKTCAKPVSRPLVYKVAHNRSATWLESTERERAIRLAFHRLLGVKVWAVDEPVTVAELRRAMKAAGLNQAELGRVLRLTKQRVSALFKKQTIHAPQVVEWVRRRRDGQ